MQPYFLANTRQQLDQALTFADRLPHFLWASIVLSCYLVRMRRLTEGFVVISGAAHLASACGLGSELVGREESVQPYHDTLLRPPKDDLEVLDRIQLARSIYLTDQGQTEVSRFRRTFAYGSHQTLSHTSDQHGHHKASANTDAKLPEFWVSEVSLKVFMMELFERIVDFGVSVRDQGSRWHQQTYVFLKNQLSSYERILPILGPKGSMASGSFGTSNHYILHAHVTLYGGGLILYSLRAGRDPEAQVQMVRSARALADICERLQAHGRLHRMHASLPSMRHMSNAARVLAHELQRPGTRERARLSIDHCNALELLLEFLDDMAVLYPAWADAPTSLKDSIAPAINTLSL
ncbi:hypothetical protein DL93DRAFT_2231689 [Clavulina sp. PMI_390]|nr:hypothetical protein DL93DRAFT_2231689 [Clavulina sp. PMI_390]